MQYNIRNADSHFRAKPKSIPKYSFTWLFLNRIKHRNNCGTHTDTHVSIHRFVHLFMYRWTLIRFSVCGFGCHSSSVRWLTGWLFGWLVDFFLFFHIHHTTEQQYNLWACLSFEINTKWIFFHFSDILYIYYILVRLFCPKWIHKYIYSCH